MALELRRSESAHQPDPAQRVAVAYTYDSDTRVTGITYSNQLGGLVYRYDVNGRIAERSDSRAGTSIPIQTRYTY